MRIGEMKESKYLKKEEVGKGKLLTMRELKKENVAMDSQPVEEKFVLYFEETPKGIVLNWTNITLISQAVGSDETDTWPGKKIVLFEDPNVSFGGKMTGGIRVRAARNQEPAKEPAKPEAEFDDSLDIPF